MHETDMTKALILTVKDWWESQAERPTISQTQNTFLAGAQLIIQETPLIAFCHPCQQEYQPEIGIQYACPTCKSPMDDIRSGRELKIDRIEYHEADHAPNL
jgi:hydrogenase nickel incorporation protein HypA/HybF